MSSLRKTNHEPAAARVLVASDRDLSRRALVALFAEQGFQTVGQATALPELVTLCRRRRHDLVVLNTRLPGTEDGSPIRGLLAQCPGEVIVAICRESGQRCVNGAGDPGSDRASRTACCAEADCLGRAFLDGACAVFRQSDNASTVIRTLRSLQRRSPPAIPIPSGVLACPIVHRVASEFRSLSLREQEVARCVGRGCTNKEIASALNVTLATVKKHTGNILTKLRLQSRLQLGIMIAHHPHLVADGDGRARPPRRAVFGNRPVPAAPGIPK